MRDMCRTVSKKSSYLACKRNGDKKKGENRTETETREIRTS